MGTGEAIESHTFCLPTMLIYSKLQDTDMVIQIW